uniref:Uncharacterized protein n=1 Tax=Anguilla anguilla TaxID=7936 RepID=A0A0E9SCJ5_ANGAN
MLQYGPFFQFDILINNIHFIFFPLLRFRHLLTKEFLQFIKITRTYTPCHH